MLCMSKPSTSYKKIHATLSNVTVTICLPIRPNCQKKVMNQCISVDTCIFQPEEYLILNMTKPCKLKIPSMVQNNLTWDSWPLIFLVSDFLTFFRIRTIRSLHLTDISGHHLAKQFFLCNTMPRVQIIHIWIRKLNFLKWINIVSYKSPKDLVKRKNVTISVCVHEQIEYWI